MPAHDYAPDSAASIDPTKVYLIKGTTLQRLLKPTHFSPDFTVQEDSTAKRVALNPITSGVGDSFDIHLRDVGLFVAGDAEAGFTINIVENYEPYVLSIREGRWLGPGEYPAPDPLTVPIYSYIGRLTSAHPSNNDTGAILSSPA